MVLDEPEIQLRVWDEVSAKLESIQPGIMSGVKLRVRCNEMLW